ncbi:hypothetical protein SAMN05660461_5303 [Chitinophaga ginsengisegetis]|uniref:Uncharacterized protein n=1 Tax=Chitinophaga ginsengisegetis TaxID=393003 RepID=A0A1T5P9I5_9BACT|nr:hypothetical protein [Chitinophaga ginsengisegetis]SKD09415.1 hypothetical protein SAMN05660461_5303 [Chitinophaga ginsengisegetis]
MKTAAPTNYIRHMNAFFAQVRRDDRLHANHVSLYMALFQIWNQHHFKKSFPILREEVIALCCIGSMNTYTRCIKELHSYGYIMYQQGRLTLPGIVTIRSFPGSCDDDTTQLQLFDELKGGESGMNNIRSGRKSDTGTCIINAIIPCRKIATGSYRRNATMPCRKSDTIPVAILRRFYNKQINNYKRERENRLSLSKKNYKDEIKNPQLDQYTPGAENADAAERVLPTLPQVQEFFNANVYPSLEAGKFFHHYQANGWQQAGKTLITDWQAAAHKWILNIHPLKIVTHEKNTKQPAGPGRLHVNENKSYSEPL